ncbi:hypothetical protein C806_01208 [Lachnospiraceae bacterium 3-1]|nr:hypothetical protein C806_01208 [Lachnospiraceae bacterium 3-1]
MIRDNHFTKPIISYIRDTKRFLICPRNYRRDFMADMEKDIQQFLLENSSAEYNDMVDYFGTPAELAQLYLENISPEERTTYTARKKLFTKFKCSILFLMFAVSVTCFYFNYIKPRELKVIYIEESLEVQEK